MNNPVQADKVKQLQKLSEVSVVAHQFFEWAASRQRDATETNVERAASKTDAEYAEMREVFKNLAGLGLGELIAGRKGFKTRMRWYYSIRSIGKAGINQVNALESINPHEVEEPEADEESATNSLQMIEHMFKLRPDVSLTVRLPHDLSSREAERIASWVRTLPFE